MKKTITLTTLSLATSILLVGCGGGASDIVNKQTQMAGDRETGYFIDSPVEGLEYQTESGDKGVTDKYGRFSYKAGEKVQFKIGKLLLGEVSPDDEGLVTPATLAENNETLKVQFLRVFQALDSDENASNGITIPKEVVESLSKLPKEEHIAKVAKDDTLLSIDKTLADKLDEDYDGHIDVNKTKAETHFNDSIDKWKSGHKPDKDTKEEHKTDNDNNNSKEHTKDAQKDKNEHNKTKYSGAFDINNYPKTQNLTQEIKDALAYMGNEERLAYDIYINLYNYHTKNSKDTIKQLQNIALRSETKHIKVVQGLVKRYNIKSEDLTNIDNPISNSPISQEKMPSGKYDIAKIQELYDSLYAKGIESKQDALEVGCMVEVTDINDLNKYINYATESNATDILNGFEFLRAGSYKHYWAFDKGLKSMGISEGCCSLGDDYCHLEYPKNSSSVKEPDNDEHKNGQNQGGHNNDNNGTKQGHQNGQIGNNGNSKNHNGKDNEQDQDKQNSGNIDNNGTKQGHQNAQEQGNTNGQDSDKIDNNGNTQKRDNAKEQNDADSNDQNQSDKQKYNNDNLKGDDKSQENEQSHDNDENSDNNATKQGQKNTKNQDKTNGQDSDKIDNNGNTQNSDDEQDDAEKDSNYQKQENTQKQDKTKEQNSDKIDNKDNTKKSNKNKEQTNTTDKNTQKDNI